MELFRFRSASIFLLPLGLYSHLPFVSRFAFLDNLLLGGGAIVNEDRADLFLLQEWISSFLSVCERNKIAGGAIVMARRRRQGRCLL